MLYFFVLVILHGILFYNSLFINSIVVICSLTAGANLMLCVFNLIPAFPTDGGRILRAILWRFFGFTKASKIASIIGIIFGVMFIALGITLACGISIWFFDGGVFNGFWMAFVGTILIKMAIEELKYIKEYEELYECC